MGGELRWASVAAGLGTCGVTRDADLYCWGYGVLSPTRVASALKFRSVSAGVRTCAISTAGATYCWELFNERVFRPATPLAGAPAFLTIASSGDGGPAAHGCGQTAAGVAYCWGFNDLGQVGSGQVHAYATFPGTPRPLAFLEGRRLPPTKVVGQP